MPRFVLAGSASGVGKTTIACGLILALKRAGYSVQPFKAGPDYIDPTYLSRVSGRPARNLDVWMMGRDGVLASFLEHSDADVSMVEGVMGYYDGSSGGSNHSSTHHVASILRSPAILVLDAGGTARSIAATALGFKTFARDSMIEGMILNRLGSARHEALCREALEPLGIPLIGCVPRSEDLRFESRHLGLVPASESEGRAAAVEKAAAAAADHVDAEKLAEICAAAEPLPPPPKRRTRPARARIAVALDDSFNFYYRDNLDSLRRSGAEISFFSPESDREIPECDGLYLGGGFPEVGAGSLAGNLSMRRSLKRSIEGGKPVYAECGGLMYLTRSIALDGRRHEMVGIFECETRMTSRPVLGYTEGTAISDCMVLEGSARLHGHEFHYSRIDSIPRDARFAYDLSLGRGITGSRDGLVAHGALASYGHLYFREGSAERLVRNCVSASRA